jgi:hypothetical protein
LLRKHLSSEQTSFSKGHEAGTILDTPSIKLSWIDFDITKK